MQLTIENRAKLACLYAGACWGVFWIPLRALEHAGLHQLWITVVYFLIPVFFLIPVIVWRWPQIRNGGIDLQITGMISGGALLLYSTSIVYTDVVRAILLFYLTPIWGTILARIFLGEPITSWRIFAMILAAMGMLTMFGLGISFPVPKNVGDWMGLASGIVWAIAMVRIRSNPVHGATETTIGFFIWSLVFAAAVALSLAPENLPTTAQVMPAIPLLFLFMVFFILPGTLASLWGPKFISPGVGGLLFMSEIVVGSITVALFSGETIGTREIIGIMLIAGASLVEPLLATKTSHPTTGQ